MQGINAEPLTFKTGFGDVKPWSDEERKEALRQKIKLEESLDNSLR